MSESAIQADTYRIGFRDWLELPEDNRLYEVMEGELFVSPPPSVRHQRILRRLLVALDRHLASHDAGEVLVAPVGVKLSDDQVVEPDLVVVLSAHQSRIGTQVLEGPPDLVVEILSPGTASRDLGPKKALYEAHGIPEYWVVDPLESRIEVLTLRSERYVSGGLFQESDRLHSALLPELTLSLDEVFLE